MVTARGDERLRVLFVTPECAPLAKTGGLGDVAEALPAALTAAGVDVRILMPAYRTVIEHAKGAPEVARIEATPHFPAAALREIPLPAGVPMYLLHSAELYDRDGGLYQDAAGSDYPDNARRFARLGQVAARLAQGASPIDWQPQIVHGNDWQCGLVPAYLRYARARRVPTVTTVHNLAFQGVFHGNLCATLELPDEAFGIDGVEYYGDTSFLKAGLFYADALTTVSETYAREIQREALGFGLHGLLAARATALHGILNGIDTDAWNPATDPFLARRYDAGSLAEKAVNKRALQRRMGLPELSHVPLFGVVSRLTHQKGSDLLAALAPSLAALPAQLVVQGRGDRAYEHALMDAARAMPRSIAANIVFDEGLAHLIEGGADAFLMPSRFEPCGLNQMYSQRYGTPPIAHRTGGLADSIVDATPAALADGTASGFLFDDATLDALHAAVARAVALYHDSQRWRALQQAGMRMDFGWSASAARYLAVYRALGRAEAA